MHRPLNAPHSAARRRPIRWPSARWPIVGGCGHVGLPLALAFARKGHAVDLLDTSPERVALVNGGRMPFQEEGADALLAETVRAGLIKATTDPAVLEDAAAIIVTIGTPVDEYLDPSVGEFDRSMNELLDRVRPGQMLVLRSTLFPGVTDRLARQLEQRGRADVDLAYCPERIVQGQSLRELEQLPQLVAGTTTRAAERAADLFRVDLPQGAVPAADRGGAGQAVLQRLALHQFRDRQPVLRDGPPLRGRLPHDLPRPARGLSAHGSRWPGPASRPARACSRTRCSSGAFNHGSFVLGQAAMMINEGLPYLIVQDVKRAYPLADMTVGVLGMAFKPNSDDPRSSLVVQAAQGAAGGVQARPLHRPLRPDTGLTPLEEVLDQADLLIVGTPHDCYKGLTFRQPVIDVTNTIHPPEQGSIGADADSDGVGR